MGISKSYLKDKFQKKQSFQAGGQRKSFPLKPEEMYFKYQAKTPITTSNYNAALVPGGSPEVQKYQKMLNEKYGTFLVEEGAWGPKTQAAYEKYIVNKEQPPAFTPTHFRPTLEEFKSIYERIPSYNYGYESLYDADPKNIYVQQGPLTKERTEQIQTLPSEEQLRQSYLGKTFGGLPMFEGEGIYEGYSPSRVWTAGFPFLGETKVETEKNINKLSSSNPRYAYFLTPKKDTQLDTARKYPFGIQDLIKTSPNQEEVISIQDPSTLKNILQFASKDPRIVNNPKYAKDLKVINTFEEKDWSDPKQIQKIYNKSIYNDVLNNYNYKIPYTPIFWEEGKNIMSEIQTNPEIMKYAEDQGIDLSQKSYFTNQLGEALVARRDALINKRPYGYAGSRSSVGVVQDPNQFILSGYLPITEDMFAASFEGGWDDPVKRKEYLKKAGVPEDMMDKVLIHTSPFPIQEYKPLKNKEGQIYKTGGKVKSKLKTSYKNKRG